MKQACCRRRRVDDGRWRSVMVLCGALLAVMLVCASCGKQKPANGGAQANTGQSQGWNITSEPAQTIPGKAVQKAAGEKCIENLRQLRMALDMYQNENESYPPSLSELPDAAKISRCPVARKDYVYDPTSGAVTCTFPGHEKF